MEHKPEQFNLMAELKALKTIESQLMSTVEQHVEDLSLANYKMLLKLQKNTNNSMVKMIAKANISLQLAKQDNATADVMAAIEIKAPSPELME